MDNMGIKELSEYLRKRSGLPTKYYFSSSNGDLQEYVLHSEHEEYVEKLRKQIRDLESAARNEYSKGYSSGQQDGPEYNMRNN